MIKKDISEYQFKKGFDPKRNINGAPRKLISTLANLGYTSRQVSDTMLNLFALTMSEIESICENEEEAFALFFKNMIENPKVSKDKKGKKMGIFIKNEYDQVGLAIKCDGQILLDTTGIVMTLLNKFYFKPHKITIKSKDPKKK